MKTGFIQAIIEGKDASSGSAFFFKNEHHNRYDWVADKAVDGYPIDNSIFGLPMGKSIDAAINGQAAFEGKAYFFVETKYYRYDWKNGTIDDGYPLDISAWGFPDSFNTGIDAAVNVANEPGKACFFKENEYVCYDWEKDEVDAGYPKNISDWNGWNLPAPFSDGIDAIVNGEGNYAGKLYFLKVNQYSRYDLATHTPETINTLTPFDNWLLLLQLGIAKENALEWLNRTSQLLKAYINNPEYGIETYITANPETEMTNELFEAALEIHFHIPATMNMKSQTKLNYLGVIDHNYDLVARYLNNNTFYVRGRTINEVLNETQPAKREKMANVPAYTVYNDHIGIVVPNFTGCGPYCQAAMVLHEHIHWIDPIAPDVYEWDLKYATMSTDDAVHNASSYASFAQHVYYSEDRRYGAGREND